MNKKTTYNLPVGTSDATCIQKIETLIELKQPFLLVKYSSELAQPPEDYLKNEEIEKQSIYEIVLWQNRKDENDEPSLRLKKKTFYNIISKYGLKLTKREDYPPATLLSDSQLLKLINTYKTADVTYKQFLEFVKKEKIKLSESALDFYNGITIYRYDPDRKNNPIGNNNLMSRLSIRLKGLLLPFDNDIKELKEEIQSLRDNGETLKATAEQREKLRHQIDIIKQMKTTAIEQFEKQNNIIYFNLGTTKS